MDPFAHDPTPMQIVPVMPSITVVPQRSAHA